MHVARALLDAGADVTGVDNFDPYYDVTLKEARVAHASPHARVRRSRASISPTRARAAALFGDGRVRARSCISPRSRACAIRSSIPTRTSATTSSRSATCSRAAAHAGVAPPGVCVVVVGVRREPRAAVLGGPARRSSGQPLRGDEEGERADGAQLQPPVPAADDRACASSPSTDRGAGPTRRRCCSRRRSSKAGRSTSSTAATCSATSRTSTTSSKASCACSRVRQRRTPARAPYAIYNIGNHEAVELDAFIATLERLLGQARASATTRPMQPGDVQATYASIDRLQRATGLRAAHAACRRARALRRRGIASYYAVT